MQEIERIILTIVGIVITLENLIVVIAAIRNKSLRDNIHYNLVISLSVCDSVLGLNVLTFGNVVMPNTNSNDKNIHLLCTVVTILTWATYHMSLVQTFYISLNRYLVIIESKLNDILWDGNRKYIMFCVTWMVTIVLNASTLTSRMQGCVIISKNLSDSASAVVLNSIRALLIIPTFVLYFLTLWKIYRLHNKTCIDDNTDRDIRKRKRMIKSMKVVSLILITLVISIILVVVLGIKGVLSQLDMVMLICFSVSNSAVNPIIYCTQIEDLNKEIKAMLRIHTWGEKKTNVVLWNRDNLLTHPQATLFMPVSKSIELFSKLNITSTKETTKEIKWRIFLFKV